MVLSAIILGFVILSLFLSMLGSSPKHDEKADDAPLMTPAEVD